MGDHIMGFVLIKFIVERHLIQETINLPTDRKKPNHTFTTGHAKGPMSSLSARSCAGPETSYSPPLWLLELSFALLS
jgi:hypothetical protein